MNLLKNRTTYLFILTFFLIISSSGLSGFQTGNLNFFINNELLFNINNTNEKTEQYYETLSIFANIKKWSFNLTLRANNYYKRDPDSTLANHNFDVYRKTLRYNSKKMKITIGDLYSVLGHGLVLSVQKNDEIFLERTILGADLKYLFKNINLRILGGEITDESYNQKWRVAGGELDLKLSKHNRFGARFSYISDVDTLRSLGDRFTYSFNIKNNKLLKHLSYYAEFAILDFTERSGETGKAIYSNLTFNKAHTTIMLEYKNYSDFDNEMNNPPVADRQDETASLNDTEGLRVLIQYTLFDPEISFFFNLGRYREYEDKGLHIYGGVSAIDIRDKFSFTFSYGIRDVVYPIKKSDADITWQISDYMSLTISAKDKRYSDNNFKFNEQDYSVQAAHSKGITVFFNYQYSFNRIIGLNNFFSGGAVINLKNDMEIRISGGTMRGGQVCSGGQCYVLPPFKGVKLSLLKTFR
ncbi:MAG: DUF6029 family protein [Acidobacteriota bacterium]